MLTTVLLFLMLSFLVGCMVFFSKEPTIVKFQERRLLAEDKIVKNLSILMFRPTPLKPTASSLTTLSLWLTFQVLPILPV